MTEKYISSKAEHGDE